MLQRNDSGYAVTITAPAAWPRLPVAVDVQPGQVADLPDLLFGWTAVTTGPPVVTVPTESPDPVAVVVEPDPEPIPPPVKAVKKADTATEPEGASK